MTDHAADNGDLEQGIRVYHPGGEHFEVRVLGNGPPQSGFFDDPTLAAEACEPFVSDPDVSGLYVTVNPVDPDRIPRERIDRISPTAEGEACANDWVQRRHCIVVDVDPERLSSTPATENERDLAATAGDAIREYLSEHGFPDPVVVDSGNGVHLVYSVDLPANDSRPHRLLKNVSAMFSDEYVTVDTSVANSARIMRIPGSWNRKGQADDSDRPHRRARILEAPPTIETVSPRTIDAIIGEEEQAPPPPNEQFDLDAVRSTLDLLTKEKPELADNRDTWRNVGCALHDAFGEEGRSLWDQWSVTSDKYDEGDQNRTWASFKRGYTGRRVTCRSIFALARKATQASADTASSDDPGWIEKLLELVEEAEDVELFRSDEGSDAEGFALVQHRGAWTSWAVRSRGFRRWLMQKCRGRFRKVPSKSSQEPALETIEAVALDGPERPVFTRVGHANGNIYLDLADANGLVVEILPGRWHVVGAEEVPVRFRRSVGMRPLPRPERGGSLEELRQILNVSGENWVLLRGFLVMLLNPWGDYAILIVDGEHGSAKTTLCLLVRLTVDPNKAAVRSLSSTEEDLVLAATNGWVICFDNLSSLRPRMSDALCRLSTGTGFATRTLYQQQDETIFSAKRPVILNGINNIATREDLASRSIELTLAAIPDDQRKTKAEVLRAFESAHGRVLGALLDAAAAALERRGTVDLTEKPRLADLCVWVTAAEPALGLEHGEFMRVYRERVESMVDDVIEASPIGTALLSVLERHSKPLETTMTDLAPLLEDEVPEAQRGRDWPNTPQKLAHQVRRLAPALRSRGVSVKEPARGANPRRYAFDPSRMIQGQQHRGDRGAAEDGPDDAARPGMEPRSSNELPRENGGDRGQPRDEGPPGGAQTPVHRGSAGSAVSPTLFTHMRPPCFACGGSRWWRIVDGSHTGNWVCGICHQPGSELGEVEWSDEVAQ